MFYITQIFYQPKNVIQKHRNIEELKIINLNLNKTNKILN